jgi:hypothetical protein
MTARHPTTAELDAGLDQVRQSPRDGGRVELIVRRPRTGEREIVPEGQLNRSEGLAGDNWRIRGSRHTQDGSALPDAQLTLMNSRAVQLVATTWERWRLAGDQLFVDLDLSGENLPSGTRLAIGSAVIEVTDQPHTGCRQFAGHYGQEAMKFVNSPVGRQLRLRGLNAKVVQDGTVRVGDIVKKV